MSKSVTKYVSLKPCSIKLFIEDTKNIYEKRFFYYLLTSDVICKKNTQKHFVKITWPVENFKNQKSKVFLWCVMAY